MTTRSHPKTTPAQNDRTAYISIPLRASEDAGPNKYGVRTNAEWLRMECIGFLRSNTDVVVAELPNGQQALTYRRQLIDEDRVVFPPQPATRKA